MIKNKKMLIILSTIILITIIGMICFFNFKSQKISTYIVTFNSDGGTAILEKTVKEGTTVEKPQDPNKEGYIFIEWLLDGKSYDFTKEINKDITLVAYWQQKVEGKELVGIKFDSDGGTTIANLIIEKGSKVQMPADPIKEGYTFIEWQLAGTKYDFELEVTDNLELVAKWEKIVPDSNTDNTKNNKDKNNSNNKHNNNNIEKIENEKPKTPTLSKDFENPSMGEAYLNIGMEGFYAENPNYPISGFELYEKNGNEYKLIFSNPAELGCGTGVTVDVGETKSYVCRVYAYNKLNEKIYSDYSNIVKVSHYIPTPTLSKDFEVPSMGEAYLNIGMEGFYAENPNYPISGFELYEKNGNEYKLIFSNPAELGCGTGVTVDVGETKSYVCRVYAYNKLNEKVYSDYSNIVKVSHYIPTPTLSKDFENPSIGTAYLNIGMEGFYAQNPNYPISGFELYEKNGNEYKLIFSNPAELGCGKDVTVDEGETKSYVCRVYAYNKLNEKVYSEYSNEVIVSNQ